MSIAVHPEPPIPEGVSRAVWLAVGARVNADGLWETPERDSEGNIIGWVVRHERPDGGADKKAKKGSKRGLTFVPPLDTYAGSAEFDPIYVVEGATCTGSGLSLDVDVVGRPSVSGGLRFLGPLLAGKHVCFVGENDQKKGGEWPGRDFGEPLAQKMTATCASVKVIYPPPGIKDLREWVMAGLTPQQLHEAARAAPRLGPATGKKAIAMDSPLGTGDEGPIPLGQHDPETGRLVLSRSRTLPTAEAYVTEFHAHPDGHTLRTYANMAMVWQGNRYIEIEDATLRNRLLPWLHAAAQYRQTKAGPILVPFNAYPPTVNSALETLKEFTHLPASIPMPCWLDDNPSRPPALEILQCRNGNLHVPTRTIMPPTPALFSPNAIGFDYDGHATTPARWLGFLDQLWGGDEQSIALLQEYFGYSLIADTSQQKALLVVGPRRAGKGTIGRVLTRLVGASNVVGPTCGGLASHFGLQGLIGKILAIISDARFHGDSIPALVERLLCIIGEDSIAVERKYLPPVTLRLPTRFVFFTNELPQFKDSSSALAGRFLVLRLTKSFYGAEDPALTDKLATELPGILNWALDGLMRLRARGRFVVPQSSEDAVRELEDLASPVGAFVRECCVVGPGHRVEVTKVWEAWKAWCADLGRNHTGDKQRLGKDLAAAVPGLLRRRGTNEPFYEGIDLNKGGWKP